MQGYQRVHQASYETGQYLAEKIDEFGPFELIFRSEPQEGIPTVTWRIAKGDDLGFTLFDLADRLRAWGWQVPAYTLTGSAGDIAVQRILVRQGVTRDLVDSLLQDMKQSIEHLTKHPASVPMTPDESSGFNHL